MNAIVTANATEPVMLSFLERAVTNENFDVAKFEVVLRAMQDERAKAAEREFYAAMAATQGEMEPIRKDAINPHTRSKYARFEAIDGQLRPIYTRHGFSVSYRTGRTDALGVVRMICTVAHAGGHSIEAELTAALDNSGAGGRTNKTDVQAVGSTVSYLRRYLLSMIWNVALAGDDDDGEGSRGYRPQQGVGAAQAQRRTPTRAEIDRILDDEPKPSLGQRITREEMDKALQGDDIPQDRARDGVLALEARIRAATSEEALHAIAGDPQVHKQRAWLAKNRPELDQLLSDALAQRYADLVAAKQDDQPEPEPEMSLP